MKSLKLSATALAVVLSCAFASAANAVPILIDFSGNTSGQSINTTYAPLGLTFSNANVFQCGGGCPLPTTNGFLAYNNGNEFSAFFSTAQSNLTFQTVSNSSTLARAFDASNTLVASIGENQGFPVTNALLALSGPGIVRVDFSSNGGVNGPTLTNLTFDSLRGGVPEPASWALMIAGFGLVGGAMRRRQSVRIAYA